MCEQWLSLLLDTTVPLGVNFTKAVFDYDLQSANLHSVRLHCVLKLVTLIWQNVTKKGTLSPPLKTKFT